MSLGCLVNLDKLDLGKFHIKTDSMALRKQTAVKEKEELLAGKDHFLFDFAISNRRPYFFTHSF